jgi:hypothetical protein
VNTVADEASVRIAAEVKFVSIIVSEVSVKIVEENTFVSTIVDEVIVNNVLTLSKSLSITGY